MRVIAENARVLVTVKTTPQPSKKYRDTVCTAGVRLDTDQPRWVRLYPIPFRHLAADSRYKKYDIIDVDIRRRTQDSRLESYQPDWDSMTTTGHLKPWAERVGALRDLPRTSVCELQRGTRARHDGPSLGLSPVAELDDLVIRANPGWSAPQAQRIETSRHQVSLFDEEAPPPLVAPRYLAWYKYRCNDRGCKGHTSQVLDWELTELQRNLRHDSDTSAQRKIRATFVDRVFASDRESGFFMGNFEAPIKRQTFSVLGVWWPRLIEAEAVSLF